MTKEKENAAIISQEEIAHGIYSMWIRTKAAETAERGSLSRCIQTTEANFFRARSVFAR